MTAGAALRIRAATPADVQVLGHIARAAKASWGYSGRQLDTWRAELEPTAESVRDQPTFTAEVEGEVVGFYQLRTAGAWAELDHLWVHPMFMRRGIGGALVAHALAYLAQSGIASLDVDADPNAEPFYTACGAVRIGVRAAPIAGEPHRMRPQLRLETGVV
jgi:GNAT superfamily N-acetyltransferase